MSENENSDGDVPDVTREVLLSFHDRKKKITMPKQSDMNESDVNYLTAVFKEEFDYTSPTSSSIIKFQCYDRDWDEHLEIDADAVFSNRDRVKVIVCNTVATTSYASTPKTSTPLSSSTDSINGLSDDDLSDGLTSGNDDSVGKLQLHTSYLYAWCG